MKKQQGSAHAIIIVVLVVALVGALGYIFCQNFVNKESVSSQTDTGHHAQSKVDETKELTVTPTLASKTLKLKAPSGWSNVTGSADSLKKTIGGEEYSIQFILAKDSQNNNNYYEYAHFVEDYASSDNVVLKTVSSANDQKLYLIKSASQRDVVLRTCEKVADTTCYLKHDGEIMIVRLYNNIPNAQSYTGIKDFNSPDTTTAISDFGIIAKSLES